MATEPRRYAVADLIAQGALYIGDGYRAKNEELSSNGLPFARAGNIDGAFRFEASDRFPREGLSRVGLKVSQPGDVVFTSKGTVGRFALVRPETEQFVYSPQLTCWRSLDREMVEPQFLFYWMQGREFQLQYVGVKGQTDMADYVSLHDQRRMHITLPCSSEQKEVAELLGALDDKIRLNRRMNQTLEAMAAALFKAWFVDFEPVRAKTGERRDTIFPRDLLELYPSQFVDSILGPIPEGWRIYRLGEVTSYLRRGISPSYDKLGVLVLNQRCVRDHRVVLEPARRHDDSKRDIAGRGLQTGDVLVNSTGVGTLGRVAQVPRLQEPAVVDSHVTVVRADTNRIVPTVLALTCFRREQEIEALGEGSTGQTELSRERLAMMQVLVPPMQIQQRFEALVAPQRSMMDCLELQSHTLAAIRDSLLPKLLSGRRRVRRAESLVGAAV